MRAVDIIRKKRDKAALAPQEISFLIDGHLKGQVSDYQMSAFLMAVTLNGMDRAETVALTTAMLNSGKRFDLSRVSGVKVDKHSTGGVGDKTSIILAPLMASMNIKVPMVSGRGLGHTGGTLDKLASIPGLRTDLSEEEFISLLKDVGMAMAGQTDELAPADRRLYALRDVTATVECIPLIAASIMSKKIAEGTQGLLLDVKVGAGAFMKTIEEARELAQTLVEIGNAMGVRTAAVITDMSQPLGKTIGNALEIKECLSALKGMAAEDLMHVTLTLAGWMLNLADAITEDTTLKPITGRTMSNYRNEAMDFIERGDAFKKFAQFVDAQHGDPEAAFKPGMLPTARLNAVVECPATGYLTGLDAMAVGTAAMLLGAGRARAEDDVDPASGIILTKKVGEQVAEGEPLAMLHFNDPAAQEEATSTFLDGVKVSGRKPEPRRLIIEAVMEDAGASN